MMTLALGAMTLVKDDVEKLASSATAACFGASNVYFWLTTESGYFSTDVRQLPLLHTWSLSVELQFYLTFPLMVLLAGRHVH